MSRRITATLTGLLLLLTVAACGSDSKTPVASGDQATTTVASGFPVTIGDVTIAERPTAIVSLSPTATET
ncbi:MAG: hypothetical protein JWO68_2817, partial [Actinomycetia bacterium]|nr:hypothetical protein [Actinomycetes bacterium]